MLLIAVYAQYFFGFTIFITSLFLVMLVLVQRGRGGGLTGALGGAGGQSAFGTKAGDLFTRITVGVASVWIILCAAAVFFLKDRALPDTGVGNRDNVTIESPREPGGACVVTQASNASPASSSNASPASSSNTSPASSSNTPTATSPEPQSPATEQTEPAAATDESATDESAADGSATTPAESTP